MRRAYTMNGRRCGQAILIASVLILAAGCGSPITQDNFAKITTGMTEAEVEAIFGKGEEVGRSSVSVPGQSVSVPGAGSMSVPGISSSARVVKWHDGAKIITVTFSDGKVAAKASSGL